MSLLNGYAYIYTAPGGAGGAPGHPGGGQPRPGHRLQALLQVPSLTQPFHTIPVWYGMVSYGMVWFYYHIMA